MKQILCALMTFCFSSGAFAKLTATQIQALQNADGVGHYTIRIDN